ncbi:MAG: hypothetical protein H0X45_13440 [Planctomycetes bacterium]|nr:hypothetical protein [Planctomycetota bacterium]
MILAPHLPEASAEELRDALLDLLIATQSSLVVDDAVLGSMEAAARLLERGVPAERWAAWFDQVDPDRWLES